MPTFSLVGSVFPSAANAKPHHHHQPPFLVAVATLEEAHPFRYMALTSSVLVVTPLCRSTSIRRCSCGSFFDLFCSKQHALFIAPCHIHLLVFACRVCPLREREKGPTLFLPPSEQQQRRQQTASLHYCLRTFFYPIFVKGGERCYLFSTAEFLVINAMQA